MSYILREKYYYHLTKFKAKVFNKKPKNSMTPLDHLPAFPENAKQAIKEQAISCLDFPGQNTKEKKQTKLVMGRVHFLRVRVEYESEGVEYEPSTSLRVSRDSLPKKFVRV